MSSVQSLLKCFASGDSNRVFGLWRFKAANSESGFASLPDSRSFYCFAIWDYGVTFGAPIRETRIVAQALLAISDFRHAESRTAGA